MSIEVVCGVNWGDEGKGRMVDYLAERADFVVRYQGGNNAGHTVVNAQGEFALHLIPSGVFYDHVTNVLGPGVVVDIEALVRELDALDARGIDCSRVLVSDRATILFPFNRSEDVWEEERLADRAFGSTKNGIAPAYGDRHLKKAIQVGDLLHPDRLAERLRHLVAWKNQIAKGVYDKGEAFTFESLMDWATSWGRRLEGRIRDTTELLEEAAAAGRTILFEAQLGALRDLYYGIYPFTTSTICLASFAPIGGGLFGARPERVMGVMKAFSTCVGEGPFVTEMDESESASLREVALEYGATTGRPRRVGHFDALASRYGVEVQGATEVALTKLDTLAGRETLRICTHYEYRGRPVKRFPLNPVLAEAQPVYTEMPGFGDDVTGCRRFEHLPRAAQRYVLAVEELVGRPIRYVSVGPERGQLMER